MSTQIMRDYLTKVEAHLELILAEEQENILAAARVMANHVKNDEIVHLYGPGGHSAVAAMEIFIRAGGLACLNAILDCGTLLNNGGDRSMRVERLPGYGKIVIDTYGVKAGDLLILVNAYGINAALIDAALEAKRLGATIIGVSSRRHAENTPPEHPARHPTKQNLHDLVDYHIDTKVPIGDALMTLEGVPQDTGAISSFASGFALHALELAVIEMLVKDGYEPPVWRSGNAVGGDEWNKQFQDRYKGRIAFL